MRRKYTPDELRRLHAELYDILGETVRVCRENGIPYFLVGGTAIGALYDNAILPWDDDVDIGMTRDAYERFLRIAPASSGRATSCRGSTPTPIRRTISPRCARTAPCSRSRSSRT